MSIDLEERIRRAANLLDRESMNGFTELSLDDRRVADTRPAWARMAIGTVALVGVTALAWAAIRPGTAGPSLAPPGAAPTVVEAGPPTVTTMAATDSVQPGAATPTTPATSPVAPATLPDFRDLSPVVPPTVVANAPTDWYRLQPDLDVAWYRDGDKPSMLCFRTPAGTECQVDTARPAEFGGGPIGVGSSGGQMLVVVVGTPGSVTIQFGDGFAPVVPVEPVDSIGWSVGRIDLPPGMTPVGLSAQYLLNVVAPETTVPMSGIDHPVPTDSVGTTPAG